MSLLLHRLNYQHLFYFWLSVREGSATAAAKRLRLSQSTVSAQVALLQDALGTKLFDRSGRTFVLTDAGRVVLRYADEIFPQGEALLDQLEGAGPLRPRRMVVGVADGVAKLSVRLALRPVFALAAAPMVACVQDDVESLSAQLATFDLDALVADEPLSSTSDVGVSSYVLHEGGVTFFATEALHAQLSSPFPACLQGAPLLLPGARSPLRRALLQWLDQHALEPRVVAEVEDSALLKALGQDGLGVFVAPSAIAGDTVRSYGVVSLGHSETLRACVYVHTVQRRVTHPGVQAMTDSLRGVRSPAPRP